MLHARSKIHTGGDKKQKIAKINRGLMALIQHHSQYDYPWTFIVFSLHQ